MTSLMVGKMHLLLTPQTRWRRGAFARSWRVLKRGHQNGWYPLVNIFKNYGKSACSLAKSMVTHPINGNSSIFKTFFQTMLKANASSISISSTHPIEITSSWRK
jgi:hypothetical protein